MNKQPNIIDEKSAHNIIPVGDEKNGQQKKKVKRAVRFGVLEDSGLPTMVALKEAGYAPSVRGSEVRRTSAYQAYKAELRAERAGLSRKKGYTLTDSARFYRRQSTKAFTDTNKIRARECLDKLLGYFAPIEIDSTETQEQRPVIQFLNILQEYKVSPADLLTMAQSEPFEAVNQDSINAISPPTCPTESANEE